MRKLLALVAVLFMVGCGWFIKSFQGPPGGTDEPLIGSRTYHYQADCYGKPCGEMITVSIIQSERMFPYCSMVAAGINCEFPSTYLMQFAALGEGGWRSLTHETASKVCVEAMRTVPLFPDAVRQCGWALMEMRFREALPPTEDKNQ